MDSLLQTDPTMPGDHIGIGDELWRSVMEIITNIHTANKSPEKTSPREEEKKVRAPFNGA